MSAQLYVRRSGGSGPAVLLLHGLFGTGGNLGALARALQARFTVYAPDLPGHGRSDWLPQYDLPRLAAAVQAFMDGEGLGTVSLVGHSLGGKVAMQLALQAPDHIDALVVADIAPVNYADDRHASVFSALQAVTSAGCTSRTAAAQLLSRQIDDEGVRAFLLASLQRDAQGRYDWRFDAAGLRRDYRELIAAPMQLPPYPGPVLFVRGGDSDYLHAGHRGAVLALFPRATLRVMPGCGHWLHVEQPRLFNGIVGRFLSERLDYRVAGRG